MEPWTIAALKEHLERIVHDMKAAHDQRFTDNQVAVDRALAAAQKETQAAFEAAEKALGRERAKQDQYNTTHNDLLRKAEDLAKLTMSRSEVELRFDAAREHVDQLVREARQQRNWTIGTVLTCLSIIIGVAFFFLRGG